MKHFSVGKVAILMAMVLVAGAVLVMPVSAVNPLYTDHFKLQAGGSVSGSTVDYFSVASTLDHSIAEHISTAAQLCDINDNCIDFAPNNGEKDVKYVIAEGTYSGGGHDHVKASFESVNPNDQGYYAVYYLTY